jgi:hypothetical protein
MCLFVAARVSGTFGKHRKTEKPKRNDQINYWLRFFVWSSLLKVLAVWKLALTMANYSAWYSQYKLNMFNCTRKM